MEESIEKEEPKETIEVTEAELKVDAEGDSLIDLIFKCLMNHENYILWVDNNVLILNNIE